MDTKKLKLIRQRLSSDAMNLSKSINRNRHAVDSIKVENTEDEGDLATISHDRDLLYNLYENDFERLRLTQEAIKAIDRGEYGECVRCGNDINEKRLAAAPWAVMCIDCKEAAEAEDQASLSMVAGGMDSQDTES